MCWVAKVTSSRTYKSETLHEMKIAWDRKRLVSKGRKDENAWAWEYRRLYVQEQQSPRARQRMSTWSRDCESTSARKVRYEKVSMFKTALLLERLIAPVRERMKPAVVSDFLCEQSNRPNQQFTKVWKTQARDGLDCVFAQLCTTGNLWK